jgi:TatA/E family protein of Tat protein translocase
MLGFSHAPELLVLLVIAFMVFGPEKLPEIARGAGRGLREFRRMSSELQASLGTTLQEPLEQVQQVHQEVRQQVAEVGRIANETFTQPWALPTVPAPAYVPQPVEGEPEPATINAAAADAQHDAGHVAGVPDVVARPPAPRRPSIALHAALGAGAGGPLTLERPAAQVRPAPSIAASPPAEAERPETQRLLTSSAPPVERPESRPNMEG